MAAKYESPSEYISHHLTFATKQVGDGGFMSINVDTMIVSILLGFVGLGFIWWVAKDATSGVPGKRQAFVELCFEFVDNQVKGIFHGERHKFVAPLALTVGLWVLLMNAMDFLPVDFMAMITGALGAHHGFRIVPTADVNTTFALALSVWFLMIGFAIYEKGAKGFIHHLFAALDIIDAEGNEALAGRGIGIKRGNRDTIVNRRVDGVSELVSIRATYGNAIRTAKSELFDGLRLFLGILFVGRAPIDLNCNSVFRT